MSKVVAIHSFRRSAGRSSLAANLAVLLAIQGRRVGILDVDFQSPTLQLLFDQNPESDSMNLNSYLWGECEIQQACNDISKNLGIKAPGALFFAPASPEAADIATMLRQSYPSERLNDGIQALEDAFTLDYVIFDTAAGISEETLAPIALADSLILLLRPDQQDYQGTAVTLDVAHSLKVADIYLALNYTPSTFDAGKLIQELETTYGCRVGALLPYSERLSTLASRRILALYDPSDAYIQEAQRLIAWLEGL